jgi:hypothetical protein
LPAASVENVAGASAYNHIQEMSGSFAPDRVGDLCFGLILRTAIWSRYLNDGII